MAELQSMKNYNAIPILQVCPGKITKIFRKEQSLDSHERNVLERSLFTPTRAIEEEKIAKAHFELKLVKIRFTKNLLESMGTNSDSVNICWQIMEFPESILKSKFSKEDNDLELSVLYKIEDIDRFCEYLETSTVTFYLRFLKNDDFVKVASAAVFFSKALGLPKVNDQVDFYHITDEEENPVLIGTLDIFYRLNIQKKTEVEFGISDVTSATSLITGSLSRRSNIRSTDQKISTCSGFNPVNHEDVEASEVEVKRFQEDLFLVLNRNKALRTTQSEISRELKDRAEWLNEEAIWRRTLQEYAILSGKDPSDVQWRQWRDVNTSQVVLRSFPNKETSYRPELDLTIVQVTFLPNTAPYRNEEVQQIYVEYSFLNMDGPEMESVDSLPLPAPDEAAVFDFEKSFGIDLGKNRRNCLLVSAMIKDKVSLRISVVSEPLPSYEMPVQTCRELGYTEVDLFNLVQLEENKADMDYPIYDSTKKDIIGTMTISFGGILALRKIALLVLAPEDYNTIV